MASKAKVKGKKVSRKKSPAKVKAKKTAAKKASAKSKQPVTQEERRQMIAEAAFLRSQERSFAGEDPIGDWLEAEREIDQKFESVAHAS